MSHWAPHRIITLCYGAGFEEWVKCGTWPHAGQCWVSSGHVQPLLGTGEGAEKPTLTQRLCLCPAGPLPEPVANGDIGEVREALSCF